MATRKTTRRVGEDSSRREPQPEYDDLQCISKEREIWYREMYRNKFVIEKTIDPNLNRELHMRDGFGVLGWQGILDLRGDYYPELVM